MNRPRLEITMLGGFSISYGGRPLSLGRRPAAKFFQLLQILLLQKDYTISKEQLGTMLYPSESLCNQNNSINNTIYRLKKFLISAGLPEEDYIKTADGLCVWCSKLPLSVDVMRFRELAVKGLQTEKPDEREEYLKQAWICYQGELLPTSSMEEWAIPDSLELKTLYEDVVRKLIGLLTEKQDFAHSYSVAAKAAALYPFEGWQMFGVDALTARKEYDKAYELYRNTEQLYFEELGLKPSEEMLRRLKAMNEYLSSGHKNLQEIQNSIKQSGGGTEDPVGAYQCNYAGFVDVYHLTHRYLRRAGKNAYIMQLSIINRKGQVIQQKYLELYRQFLETAIEGCLRTGDVYTEYEPGNFLVLLVEGNATIDCEKIFQRIMNRFDAQGGSRRAVQYQFSSIFDQEEMEGMEILKHPFGY